MASTTVGWVGLGAMGKPMALNLNTHLNKQLHVYNRDGSKCAALVADGATQCSTLEQLAEHSSVVFMMLADDAAVLSVVEGLLKQPANLKVLVDCSTIAPATSDKAAELARAAGVHYVASPVFGRPDAAAAKQLVVVVAGQDTAVDTVHPYLDALGRKVIKLGTEPRKATTLKLAGNFSIVGIIEMLGEGMALCERSGLTREQYLDFITTFYPVPPVIGYATRMARDEIAAGQGFAVNLALKDVGHMRRMAQDACCPLPLADLAFQHLLTAKALGYGGSDWGALALAHRAAANLPLPTIAADQGSKGGVTTDQPADKQPEAAGVQ